MSHSDRLATERLCVGATNVAREAALAFLDADENNDDWGWYVENDADHPGTRR